MREDNNWELDKRISIAHVISTIVIAGSCFMWAMAMSERIKVLETRYEQRTVERAREEQATKEIRLELRQEMLSISSKIDKLRDQVEDFRYKRR